MVITVTQKLTLAKNCRNCKYSFGFALVLMIKVSKLAEKEYSIESETYTSCIVFIYEETNMITCLHR